MLKNLLKKVYAHSLTMVGGDRLARWWNRNKLLTVMYHGVTRNQYYPPVWTQLPVNVFEEQIVFLKKHYHPITLQELLSAIEREEGLPERSVLVTFDDGLKNNATVAWPILKKLEVPATIFLTVDFIGTDLFFWVDELYIYLVEAHRRRVTLPLTAWPAAAHHMTCGNVWDAYMIIVENCKRMSREERMSFISSLDQCVGYNRNDWQEDFGLLNWEQIESMSQDGLIDYGVHTATHQILTEMPPESYGKELAAARCKLEQRLGRPMRAFCYPNGRKGVDFTEEHQQVLKDIGYLCAFSTDRGLYHPYLDDLFAICRIAAGNDMSSHPRMFRLNTANLRLKKHLVAGNGA